MSNKRDAIKFEKMNSSRRGQRVIYSNAAPAYDPVPEHIRRRREFKIVSPQIERNRKRARNMTPLYLVGLMLCIGFFALLAHKHIQLNSEIVQVRHDIMSKEAEYQRIKTANDEEYARIMGAVDLEEIKRTAMDDLGMHYPDNSQIIEFENDDSDYVRQFQDIPTQASSDR
ncbi:MAG: hypothetical protein IJM23_07935 [Lachnospiraceae bacterium]|nr:hypothetical protein [Lachnospiraceae bacterium]